MTRYVAWLRGINLGPKTQVAMADLRRLAEGIGLTGVATYVRSGNLVFGSDASESALEKKLAGVLQDELGRSVDVVVRSRREIAAVLVADPFADVATDQARSVVVFLAGTPAAGPLAEFVNADWAPEQVVHQGRELYLWCPNGQANSPMVEALWKAKLGTSLTARNRRTVAKVLTMLDAEPD